MSSDNKLRFKVTVSQAYPALLEAMNQGRPYYRSRRLVELASLGLWLEQHGLTPVNTVSTGNQTVPTVIKSRINLSSGTNPPTAINVEPDESEKHYTIPDDPEALKDFFDYLEKPNKL